MDGLGGSFFSTPIDWVNPYTPNPDLDKIAKEISHLYRALNLLEGVMGNTDTLDEFVAAETAIKERIAKLEAQALEFKK